MKKEKGITLIALVITIIVLLILAGVTIATLTGNNGLLTRSNEAKEETVKSTEMEEVQIAVVGASGKNKNGSYTNTDLQEELDNLAGKGKTEVTGEGTFTVLFKETQNRYYVTEDGNVNQIASSNIYKYNNEGYITGVKDEYIEEVDRFAKKETKLKYASLNTNFKIAARQPPSIVKLLKEEVGTMLIIPSEIDGVRIKGIADNAFSVIINLTDIIMADTIETIGDNVFTDCESLKKVQLSQNLKKLGKNVFNYCYELESIELPDGLEEIGDECFRELDDLKEIYIPISVRIIGEEAFTSSFDRIYCGASEKPEGWTSNWYQSYGGKFADIQWGVTR